MTFIPAKLRVPRQHHPIPTQQPRVIPKTSPVRRRRISPKKPIESTTDRPSFNFNTTTTRQRPRRVKQNKNPLKESKEIHVTAEKLLNPVSRNQGDSAVSSHFGERLRALRVSVEAGRDEEEEEEEETNFMKSQYSRRTTRSIRTESSVSSAAERLRKAQQRAFETKRLCAEFLKEAKAYIRPMYTMGESGGGNGYYGEY